MLTQAPISINWNFTDSCNFNCLHCYSRGRPHKAELTVEQQLDIARKIAESHVFIVNFGGGEPLLIYENLLPVIQTLSSANVATYVSTNAWHINENLLKKLKTSGLTGFYVSLDSLNADIHDYIRRKRGCFNQVMKRLDQIYNYGFKLGLSTVISKYNWKELDSIISFAICKHCNMISLKRFRPVGNGNTHSQDFVLDSKDEIELNNFIMHMKDRYANKIDIHLVYSDFPQAKITEGCPCGRTSLGLMPNGDLKMCVYGSYIIGNLLSDDLQEIWQTHPYLVQNRKHHVCEAL